MADADGGERVVGREVGGDRLAELDLVDRGDLVTGADLTGVDRVDPEVVVGDGAVLVADQAVARDRREGDWVKPSGG